jgi:BirA family transcriptional regulator, biotin operon repressor / biotin---[acetyl-CoA-carboxylase] ligase
MLGQDSLERAVRAAGIDVRPVWFEETGSTNEEALDLAERGAPAWTVVATGHQTAGKGRLGRSWSDVPGKALMFSVVLRPTLEPDRVPLISLLAAVAMIEATGLPSLRSKWPNDLVVEERKVGGILAEARIATGRVQHAVLGIGMNLSMDHSDFPEEVRAGATSLAAEGGSPDPGSLVTRFLAAFHRGWHDGTLGDRVVRSYREVCATLGRRVRATTTSGDVVEGIAVDLDRRGGLALELEGSRHRVAFGDVVHLR